MRTHGFMKLKFSHVTIQVVMARGCFDDTKVMLDNFSYLPVVQVLGAETLFLCEIPKSRVPFLLKI